MKTLSIVGRLGQGPKVNTTQSGESVLNCSVAVSNRVKKNGQWVDESIWIGVTLFGKRAESISQHMTKGMRVAASGDLNVREYDARDGSKKTAIELIARDIELLFDKREGGGERPQSNQREPAGGGYQGYQGGGQSYGGGGATDTDDIPFAPLRGEI
jgi:single-strand DNA-binding protein